MSDILVKSKLPVRGMLKLGAGTAEKVLLGFAGVKSATASLANNTVMVEYNRSQVSERDMYIALGKAGFPMEVASEGAGKPAAADGIVKITSGVKGMSCSGCEAKIERILSRLEGVREAKASFSDNSVIITFDGNTVSKDAMAAALDKAGYTLETNAVVGKRRTGSKTAGPAEKKLNIKQLVGLGIILFAVYFVVSKTVGFNFIPEVNQSMGYGVLFLVGLLTSIHCVAMCGGINISQCVSRDGQTVGKPAGKLKPSLMYNAGRVISYTIVGGIVGAVGSVVSFSGWARGVVAIASGLFMLIMGLSMLGIFPWLNKITPRMPKFLRSKANQAGRGKGPFIVGLLNGFMPCGPLQAMQLYALGTGNVLTGALSMLLFSLGTVPLMFGLGALSSMLSSRFTSKMMKISAALVLLLGLVMVNRGFALSGVNLAPTALAQPKAATGQNGSVAGVTITNGVQTITSELPQTGYPNITVQKGIPVKWTIKADAKNLSGCNRTLVIQKFNKEITLKAGDNIIEFTPDDVGTISYSCWMGMITGRINVVADIAAAPPADTANDQTSGGTSAISGGCCASAALAPQFAGGKIPTDNIAVAKTVGGVQEVTITVSDQGYSPAVAVVQKGVKTKIKFVGEKLNSCNSTVYFPDFNGSLDLSVGQLETPALTPEKDFTFECGMSMLHGYVRVVDDIKKVNMDEVKETIRKFVPSTTGGGCCG